MKEKLAKVFEIELFYTGKGLENEDDTIRRNEICWYARQRGLGAINMAQECGLDYPTCEVMFNEYCAKLEKMENEVC